jgi:hypothetical protein
MRDALQDTPAGWFSRPQGVYAINIDRETGLLPTKECEHIMTEYFLEGTIPTEYSTECGEGKGGDESFNIDIFNRKEDSSGFFGSPSGEDEPFAEEHDLDFDLGIEEDDQPYPAPDAYPNENGEADSEYIENGPKVDGSIDNDSDFDADEVSGDLG